MDTMTILGTAIGGLIIWTAILSMVINASTNQKKLREENKQIIDLLTKIANKS